MTAAESAKALFILNPIFLLNSLYLLGYSARFWHISWHPSSWPVYYLFQLSKLCLVLCEVFLSRLLFVVLRSAQTEIDLWVEHRARRRVLLWSHGIATLLCVSTIAACIRQCLDLRSETWSDFVLRTGPWLAILLFVGVFAGWCTSWTIGKWLALRKMVGDHERILELRRIVDEQKRSRGLEGAIYTANGSILYRLHAFLCLS
jgi:hypothetical protein